MTSEEVHDAKEVEGSGTKDDASSDGESSSGSASDDGNAIALAADKSDGVQEVNAAPSASPANVADAAGGVADHVQKEATPIAAEVSAASDTAKAATIAVEATPAELSASLQSAAAAVSVTLPGGLDSFDVQALAEQAKQMKEDALRNGREFLGGQGLLLANGDLDVDEVRARAERRVAEQRRRSEAHLKRTEELFQNGEYFDLAEHNAFAAGGATVGLYIGSKVFGTVGMVGAAAVGGVAGHATDTSDSAMEMKREIAKEAKAAAAKAVAEANERIEDIKPMLEKAREKATETYEKSKPLFSEIRQDFSGVVAEGSEGKMPDFTRLTLNVKDLAKTIGAELSDFFSSSATLFPVDRIPVKIPVDPIPVKKIDVDVESSVSAHEDEKSSVSSKVSSEVVSSSAGTGSSIEQGNAG
eukprot:TRINITY_DN22080_c0_g1_i1.p1 TRINITY_DN22080_c0_g1~~TRINITY_DN22080_c0_g1_i1.p1  ORF type:complete len:477 (-),score=107.74 TRINITY_DN22080_c0_g1_i1:429-1673(-)